MKEELILGIDDAGRGPVIGPMILAGCIITKEISKELDRWGVKDSKQLTNKRRFILEEKIKTLSKGFHLIKIYPDEIEENNKEKINLNELEAIAIAKIINKMNLKNQKIMVVVDCPSPSILKWRDFLMRYIEELSNLEIVCEHKADKNHLAVSAASILAKCERERELEKLKKEFGEEIGSGYTSDPLTKDFLEKNAIKFKDKNLFRKTWITWQKAYDNLKQNKLDF